MLLAVSVSAAVCLGHAEAAETSDVFALLPSPDLMVVDGRLVLKLPPLEYAVGVVFGLALALLSIWRLAGRGPASLPRPLEAGGFLARFGPMRALASNGFVWVYVLLIVGFAGLVYSGLFQLIRERFSETLPGLASWGPAAPIVATFAWTLLYRNFSWFKSDGVVEAVVDDIEAQSTDADANHWLNTLAWSGLESERETRETELALLYSVGLIRHALERHCEAAIDRGRLAPAEVEPVLEELRRVRPGTDDRERFINRRCAIEIATRIVPLGVVEETLQSHDRRAAERRIGSERATGSEERRRGRDRRVDGTLVAEAA